MLLTYEIHTFQPSYNSSGPKSYTKARPSQVAPFHDKLTIPSSHLPVHHMLSSHIVGVVLLFNISWVHTTYP